MQGLGPEPIYYNLSDPNAAAQGSNWQQVERYSFAIFNRYSIVKNVKIDF